MTGSRIVPTPAPQGRRTQFVWPRPAVGCIVSVFTSVERAFERRRTPADEDMPEDETSHSACVRAWMEGAASGLSREDALVLFERALSALWQRAHRTLGEVTLSAIVDRVLHDVSAEFPLIAGLEVGPSGFRVDKLQNRDLDVLDGAMRRTLVELLTVIGNLTADILTPGLHAALSSVSLPGGARGETGGSKR